MTAEHIDWSQLWYPGPKRRFTADEMARAGSDVPPRTAALVAAWMGVKALWRAPRRGGPRDEIGMALVACAAGLMLMLAWWFVCVYRAEQIAARLREQDERAQALAAARQLASAQVQPHFLFNSLASLQHWVHTQDNRAPALLAALMGFLRTTLPLFERPQLRVSEEAQCFGSAAWLTLAPAPEGGTLACIECPLTTGPA